MTFIRANGFIRRSAGFVAHTLLFLVIIVVLSVAGQGVVEARRFSELTASARYASQNGSVSDATLARLMRLVPKIAETATCRSDIVNAGIGFTLLDLDRRSASAPEQEWKEQLDAAEALLRYSLACEPGDGNRWLRLAMVRSLKVPFPEEIAVMFNLSQRLAPAHPDVIKGRFALWNTLSPRGQEIARSSHDADLAALCSSAGGGLRRAMPGVCATMQPSEPSQPEPRWRQKVPSPFEPMP